MIAVKCGVVVANHRGRQFIQRWLSSACVGNLTGKQWDVRAKVCSLAFLDRFV